MIEHQASERLRVLAVLRAPSMFGTEVITLDYFSRLRRWVDCHFVLTKWGDGEFGRRLDPLGIVHSALPIGMFSSRLDAASVRETLSTVGRIPYLCHAFRRLVATFDPDIVYVTTNHDLLLFYPVLRTLHVPIVCHMHDPPPNVSLQRASFRIWATPVDRFIAISENVRDRLCRLPLDPQRVVLLHNGIDVARYPQRSDRDNSFIRQFGWPDDAFVAGISGAMWEQKGHLDLLEALDSLRDRLPHLRLVIGGRLGGRYSEQLRRFVTERRLEDRVGFCGWLDDARQLYTGIDVFVLASRHEEGFGLVLGEAMASGVPVIATRSGGAVNVIEDDVSGLLVDRCAPDQIAASLERLHSDPALRARFVAAGRLRVETEFNLERQAEKLVGLLRDTVLGHRRNARNF